MGDNHGKTLEVRGCRQSPGADQILGLTPNGYLALNRDPTKPVTDFSQADVDSRKIVFIRSSNGSTAGFTFFVSDGKQETERHWFTVEISDLSATLEANNRLVLPPGAEYPIRMDLLRASIPNAEAGHV